MPGDSGPVLETERGRSRECSADGVQDDTRTHSVSPAIGRYELYVAALIAAIYIASKFL